MKKKIIMTLGLLAIIAGSLSAGPAEAHRGCGGRGWGAPQRWNAPPAWGRNNSYRYNGWDRRRPSSGYNGGSYRRVAHANPWGGWRDYDDDRYAGRQGGWRPGRW